MIVIPAGPRVSPVRSGSAVGVVAPGSAPADSADLAAGIGRLQQTGVEVVCFFEPEQGRGYLSDSDARRAAFLNEAVASDGIQALFCARGGYGSLRILDDIDYESLIRFPKIVVGYSDITALQLAILARTGIPGLSAAMVATDWASIDNDEVTSIMACLSGDGRGGLFARGGLTLKPERPGYAEGRCIGGNLSVICKLLGTPYFPDLTGAVLFVEEVGEPPYRVDGLFAQLRLAGVLGRLAGMVLGGFTDSDAPEGKPSLTLDEVLRHYVNYVGGPVASGLPYGHFRPKVPVPVGTRVGLRVNQNSASLVALEQLVTP